MDIKNRLDFFKDSEELADILREHKDEAIIHSDQRLAYALEEAAQQIEGLFELAELLVEENGKLKKEV